MKNPNPGPPRWQVENVECLPDSTLTSARRAQAEGSVLKNPNPGPPRWQVENVECLPDNHIKFDFLGKDSIRYENEVAVHATVWRLVQQFCRGDKKGGARALPAHGPPLPLSHFSGDALPLLLPQLMASAGPHARVPRGLSDCACSSRTRRRTPEPGVSAAHPRLCRCVRCTCGGAAR